LRYFKEHCADSIAVADTHFIVGQSLNRKIFAELPEREILTAQLTFPVLVGIDLIDQNCSVLAAMPGEIALGVTVDIQPPDQASALNRVFPHARVHGLTAPRKSPTFTDNKRPVS
jgi:hypothetical protein